MTGVVNDAFFQDVSRIEFGHRLLQFSSVQAISVTTVYPVTLHLCYLEVKILIVIIEYDYIACRKYNKARKELSGTYLGRVN